MLHSYNIFLLSLFLTYSISNDIENRYFNRTIASSRSIYELVQIRRAAARLAAYYNKTHRNNSPNSNYIYINTSESKIGRSNDAGNRFLMERLKTIIYVSSIALIFMTVIVTVCIIARCFQRKTPTPTERIEQTKSLTSSTPTRYTYIYQDTRNFSRKPRILPTAL